MAGILLASGQTFVLDSMKSYIDSLGGLYIGLMKELVNPAEDAQLPTASGITEIDPLSDGTGSGYARRLISTWTATAGTDPILSGDTAIFTVSGTWNSVNGYFVSATAAGYDALWAETFPVGSQGTKYHGDVLLISPIYQQQDRSEV